MTRKEIAMAAIGKVQKAGCDIPWQFVTEGYWEDIKDDEVPLELMGFFFSKEFAKHYWGEEKKEDGKWFLGYTWQLGLRQMALAGDRMQFLKKFL